MRRSSRRALGFAGAANLLVLFATSLLRPVRDAMGVEAGVGRLPWLFSATFVALLAVVPLHGWAARRLPRRALVPSVWLVVALGLVGFRVLFGFAPESRLVASAFFVAAAALNLIVVSSFWSQLSDLVEAGVARRLFGPIAACGTLGALAAYATVSTYFYLTQSTLVATAFGSPGLRTAYFARIDLAVNLGALLLQLFVTPYVALRFGAVALLAAVPAAVGLALPLTVGELWPWLGFSSSPGSSLALVSALYVVHRAGSFALFRPGRELLATRFELAERFQAKNFLDTAVYRTSDAAAAWVVPALGALGAAAPTLGVALVALVWAAVGLRLGRRFDDETRHRNNAPLPALLVARSSTDPT